MLLRRQNELEFLFGVLPLAAIILICESSVDILFSPQPYALLYRLVSLSGLFVSC